MAPWLEHFRCSLCMVPNLFFSLYSRLIGIGRFRIKRDKYFLLGMKTLIPEFGAVLAKWRIPSEQRGFSSNKYLLSNCIPPQLSGGFEKKIVEGVPH